jgi:hypothetical protein
MCSKSSLLYVLGGVLLVLAMAEFVIRGPIRAVEEREFNDFLSPYIQTKAWLQGRDPYSSEMLAQLWPTGLTMPEFVWREARNGVLPAKRGIPSPYPFTSFPLLSPLALISWHSAILVWLAICEIAFVSTVAMTLAIARIPCFSFKGGAVFACALALAPFHTAIAASNIVLAVLAICVLSCLYMEDESDCLGGILLGAASALKPTVAAAFLLYFVAKRKWRVLVIALAAGGALLLVADVRMLWNGVHPVASYVLNNRRMFGPGGIDDFTSANPLRFDLLNSQVILFQISGSVVVTQGLVWLLFGGLLTGWLYIRFLHKEIGVGLIDLAFLSTLILLPIYHRFTDGGLLFFPVVWAIAQWEGRVKLAARAVLLFASFFALPGAAILRSLAESNSSIRGLAQSAWWKLFVAPHQAWSVLMITVFLLLALVQMAPAAVAEGRIRQVTK